MIPMLYEPFKKWCANGSIWIISDTHFEDIDCKLMDPGWITPEEHMCNIREKIHKSDTLIHLGDVGRGSWLDELSCHMVLITGNHDTPKVYCHFDEVFNGPLIIAPKIILSHEPIHSVDWAINIHGHDHDMTNTGDNHHLNVASNVIQYVPINLGELIKTGLVSNIRDIHRITIDEATSELPRT